VSFNRLLATIQEFVDVGVREVLFSGGEPLLVKGFVSLIEELSGVCAADIYIATNGMLMSREIARRLKRSSVRGIDISLDGHTPELHNAVRLHPAAFSKAVEGIRTCVAEELPLRISGMVTSRNAEHIEDYIEFLVSLGVRQVVLNMILEAAGRARENPQLVVQPRAGERIVQSVFRAKQRFGEQIHIDCRFAQNHSPVAKGCPAGLRLLHITADGEVSPCSWLYKIDKTRFTLGNIKHDSLRECLQRNSQVMQPLVTITQNCPIPHVHP
jgi:MoaA/NifB/PqqE/SkfB family radical SAM enzyme